MAARKTTRKPAARKPAARKPAAAKPRTRTTRTTTTRKTVLSEIGSRANLRAGGQMILEAAAGGAVGTEILKNMSNQTKLQRVGLLAILAYITGTAFKMPSVAAGVAAIAGVEFMKDETPAGVSENANYLSQNDLDSLPEVIQMSEMPMLNENPYAYMSENEFAYMSESPFYFSNPYQ